MAIATGAIGLASGVAKFFEGQSQQSKAQKAIDNFKFTELENPYESLSVSTIGAEHQLDQASQQSASTMETLKSAGARGVLGGLPQLTAQQQNLTKSITADLDQQQKKINFAAAGQDVRNQGIKNQMESQELAGYGQQLNVGMGMKYGGLTNLTNAAGFIGELPIGAKADSFIKDLFTNK